MLPCRYDAAATHIIELCKLNYSIVTNWNSNCSLTSKTIKNAFDFASIFAQRKLDYSTHDNLFTPGIIENVFLIRRHTFMGWGSTQRVFGFCISRDNRTHQPATIVKKFAISIVRFEEPHHYCIYQVELERVLLTNHPSFIHLFGLIHTHFLERFIHKVQTAFIDVLPFDSMLVMSCHFMSCHFISFVRFEFP